MLIILGCILGTKCRRSIIQHAAFNPAQGTVQLYNHNNALYQYLRAQKIWYSPPPDMAQLNATFLAVAGIVVAAEKVV